MAIISIVPSKVDRWTLLEYKFSILNVDITALLCKGCLGFGLPSSGRGREGFCAWKFLLTWLIGGLHILFWRWRAARFHGGFSLIRLLCKKWLLLSDLSWTLSLFLTISGSLSVIGKFSTSHRLSSDADACSGLTIFVEVHVHYT